MESENRNEAGTKLVEIRKHINGLFRIYIDGNYQASKGTEAEAIATAKEAESHDSNGERVIFIGDSKDDELDNAQAENAFNRKKIFELEKELKLERDARHRAETNARQFYSEISNQSETINELIRKLMAKDEQINEAYNTADELIKQLEKIGE